MGRKSIIITQMQEVGIVNPLAELRLMAESMTTKEIAEMYGFTYFTLSNFLARQKIKPKRGSLTMKCILGENALELMREMVLIMTCAQIARKLDVPVKMIQNYLVTHELRAIRPNKSPKTSSNHEREAPVQFFKCSRCDTPKNVILMSNIPNLCQRCKKLKAMERV